MQFMHSIIGGCLGKSTLRIYLPRKSNHIVVDSSCEELQEGNIQHMTRMSDLQREVTDLGLSVRKVIEGNDLLRRDIAGVAEITRAHLAQANKNMEGLHGSVESLLAQIQGAHEDRTDAVGWQMLAFGLLVALCAVTWSGAQAHILLAPLVGVMIPVCFPSVRKVLGLAYRRIIAKLELALSAPAQQAAVVAATGTDALAQTAEHRPDPSGVNGNGHH